jgi:protein TonB
MKFLPNSIYNKSTVTSILIHGVILVAFILMPPSVPVNSAKSATTIDLIPVPEQQQEIIPSQPEINPIPEQAQVPQPDMAPAPSQPSAAPQAAVLPGETGLNSVALQSGTGSVIPSFTGIPSGPPDSVGTGAGTSKGIGHIASSPVSAKLIYGPKPTYPFAAKEAGWEGTVMVRIRINTDGSVTVLSVPTDRSDIREAAAAAAAARQYSPALDADGTPVTVERVVRVKFDLTEAND